MSSNGRPFTRANGAMNQRKARRSRTITSKSQAVDLLEALHSAGLALAKDIPTCIDRSERARVAGSLAAVAKGWQSMNDQLRVMRGVPLPGSLRPDAKPKAL